MPVTFQCLPWSFAGREVKLSRQRKGGEGGATGDRGRGKESTEGRLGEADIKRVFKMKTFECDCHLPEGFLLLLFLFAPGWVPAHSSQTFLFPVLAWLRVWEPGAGMGTAAHLWFWVLAQGWHSLAASPSQQHKAEDTKGPWCSSLIILRKAICCRSCSVWDWYKNLLSKA